jgi:hypothetical protein
VRLDERLSEHAPQESRKRPSARGRAALARAIGTRAQPEAQENGNERWKDGTAFVM